MRSLHQRDKRRERERPMRGTGGRCPRCASTKTGKATLPAGLPRFYADEIAICGNCGAAWEPLDESLIWDRTDPACSFREPCANCAFRPGSPEQADTEKWADLMAKLRAGGYFFCHKGVPIAPASEDGFDYPKKREKLRLCRGFLNAWGQWARKDFGEASE